MICHIKYPLVHTPTCMHNYHNMVLITCSGFFLHQHAFTEAIEDMLTATGDDYFPFTSKFQALAFMLVNSPRPLVRSKLV